MVTHDPDVLSLVDVEVIYGEAIVALRGVSFDVPGGAIVALLGANGAGKTTTLRAISGLLGGARGSIRRGGITWAGLPLSRMAPAALVARGMVQVLEGRHCFAHLTVEETLLTGSYVRRLSRPRKREELDRVYQWFPRLRDRRHSRAGFTSGGEQQMVAIGRALMTGPRLVLLDEPSMGLAPRIAHAIFEIVRDLNRNHGITFLVAEQNAAVALEYSDHAHVLDNGRVAISSPAAALAGWSGVTDIYVGGTAHRRGASATVTNETSAPP